MTDNRPRDRSRVQEVSYADMEGIRRREYTGMRNDFQRRDVPSQSLVKVSRADSQDDEGRDEREDYARDYHSSRRYRGSPGRVGARPASHHELLRRRYSSEDSESEDEEAHRRRRSSRRSVRRSMVATDKVVGAEIRDEAKKAAIASRDDGYLWYSMKKRSEANFMERHFDSSYDGLIAGVAGAAIGSITAARFGGQQHRTAKAVGGAVLGALAFNAAESHWRVWTEMTEEVREKRDEAKEELKDVVEKAKRFVPNP